MAISAGTQLAFFAAEVGLNARQRAFVEAYLADPQRNQELAAKKAGYASPLVQSYEVLKSPKVKQFLALADKKIEQGIAKRFNVAVMKPQELRARLSDQARGAIVSFLDPETGNLDLARLQAEDKGHLVKKLEIKKGAVRVEPTDPQGALRELASHYGMSKDRGAQLPQQINITAVVQAMHPEEQAALREGLRALNKGMLQSGAIDVEAE